MSVPILSSRRSALPAPVPCGRCFMAASETGTRVLMYGIAGAIFATDRLTKWLIETRVSAFDTHTVIPGFFDIVHSQNSGAAFGLFADSASQWRSVLLIGFSFVALVV